MLRITITEMATEQRWTLEGRLVQPWVGELRENWKKRHRPQNGRTCTVDLSQITCIDNSGLRLLRTMSKEDTHFVRSVGGASFSSFPSARRPMAVPNDLRES